MSKRVKNLLVIGLFILSMAIVLVILIATQPKKPEETPTDLNVTIPVVTYRRDDTASFTIKNETGEFTIKNGVSGFSIPDFAGLRQNSTTMGAAAKCVAELTAQALVEENAQDLEKYGLSAEAPAASCDVVMKDGTAYTLYFGIDSPDGTTRYVRKADSNDVYTTLLTSSGYMFYSKEDFLSLVVTEELKNNNTVPTLDHMTVTRKDFDYVVEFIDDSKKYSSEEVSMASAQVMISPVYAYLDITNSNAIMYGLWGLTASRAVAAHPDEETFKTYGIDDPFCEVNLDAELQNYNLKIGNVCEYELDDNGNPTSTPYSYYCYFNQVDILFVLPVSEIPWVNFRPIDILTSGTTGNYIYSLDYIDFDFSLPGEEPVSYHNEMTCDLENKTFIEATIDGTVIEEMDYKQFYQFILKNPIDDLCFDEPDEASKVAKIDIVRQDGGSDVLEFYDVGNGRVTVKLNGVTSFSQPISYLKVLKQNIQTLISGGTKDDLVEVW